MFELTFAHVIFIITGKTESFSFDPIAISLYNINPPNSYAFQSNEVA